MFCVTTARMTEGQPTIDPPLAFWDRQASYRHFLEAGGRVPRRHQLEPLEHLDRDQHIAVAWHVVDVPDRKKYDPELIHEIVRKILAGEISQSEASRLYGPSQSRISEWVRTHSTSDP